MKYKKKPIIIEAVQCTNTDLGKLAFSERPGWLKVAFDDGTIRRKFDGLCYVHTLEGRMCLGLNDWVIRGGKGELYPCKDDIFKMTYELVE